MLPRFEVVARRRPVALTAPGSGPVRAPYVAVEAPGSPELTLSGGPVTLTATFEGRVTLHLTTDGRTTSHRSRRSGRPEGPVEAVALTLTGPQVTAFTREAGSWVARARADLTERYDVHDETWLSGLTVSHSMGRFGQLGLRDLRLVSQSDGSPYLRDGRLLLTATSAGPGGFTTGHCSVWSLDPETLELEHRADLFVRRGVDHGVYGDHAAHLLRDGDRWLLAASTWGDFDPHRRPVGVVLAETTDDVTRGVHVLDGRPFALPTDGFRSVGVWDPHLVRSGSGWLVGYVSATKYFRFHPVLAAGPDLDSLVLRAVAEGHRETEGTTLTRLTGPDGEWRVLASDKRRRCYPVLDLDLREVDRLDAFYPTNIPWPTIATLDSESLLVGFNGAPYGGRLVGYGSHGEVVLQRASGD
ncbi:MAG TPA: hypothetical protein DEQ43_26220 [Nocardioides bacterium]|uniref:hypothetical protein n=1 Tax=uncultured Nocardioides sp. TaxID=198441 RepID=UPI000EB9AEAB|nr:hypothetical protein [uncultured Nocardioides sp.]HCB07706.1 hypothetical protein [Nocardioides sp.]